MPSSLGDEILKLGWRAGAVIGHDSLSHATAYLAHPGKSQDCVDESDWLVIVSQTCDVVAQTIKGEPFVEVLHCKPINKLRSQYLRSTRILDFRPNRDTHSEVILSAHANADRYLIPREILGAFAPDPMCSLSRDTTTRVLAWYSLRYARPAWPNSFVARISEATTLLEEALDPLKDDIAEVRISIAKDERNKELKDNEVYHVAIFFIIDGTVWDGNVDGRLAIQTAFTKFVKAIKGCHKIEINEELSNVFSGDDFSWQATRSSDEWNFANLTHQE